VVAFTTLTTILLTQSSTRPWIGPAMPPGPPNTLREIALTIGHLTVFSLLVLVWSWALRAHWPLRRAVYGALIFALCYSPITELLQSLVPDRSASWYDLLVNAFAAGLTAALLLRRR
jgi:VanZ family protein